MRRLARPLLYVGTVGIIVALGRYHAQFVGHYVFHTSERLPWELAYAVVLCVAAYGMGLPDLDRHRRAWGPCLTAGFLGAAVVSVAQLVVGSPLMPRFVTIAGLGLTVPWFAVCVGLADIGRARLEEKDRVVLVGGAAEDAALEAEMANDLERPALLAASLAPFDIRPGDLTAAVAAASASIVVLDRRAMLDERIVAEAAALHAGGVRVRSLSAFYEDWMAKLPCSELEQASLLFDIGELHRTRYARVKRALDVLVGLFGLLVLAVVTPFVLCGNLLGNKGPLLYRQQRVGRGGRTIEILKFRTMLVLAGPSAWTADKDPRITPLGGFLRRSHIDELPQLLNVLRGSLTLVGPRPEQPRYVEELTDKIPFYSLRHIVRPGITGWAQVKYPYGATETDALEKLQYDFYYLRHQSLRLDARIVGRTARAVIGRTGR